MEENILLYCHSGPHIETLNPSYINKIKLFRHYEKLMSDNLLFDIGIE